ncbi:hypothetical protein AB3S75_028601 [Citrus x aurantiifolia]
MVAVSKQSLLYFEDLTPPSFQVIVVTANMGCTRCRGRVSQIISKLTGLEEYIVDVPNKRVTVKADFGLNKNVKDDPTRSRVKISGCYQFFISVSGLFASAAFLRIKQKSA